MRDLAATINGAVSSAFKVLDSLKTSVILIYGSGTYDPATDTTSDGQQTQAIRGFFYRSEEQQAADTAGNTATVLLQSSDVAAAGLSQIVDEANKVIVGGVTWEITSVIYDPVGATVKLYVRHG